MASISIPFSSNGTVDVPLNGQLSITLTETCTVCSTNSSLFLPALPNGKLMTASGSPYNYTGIATGSASIAFVNGSGSCADVKDGMSRPIVVKSGKPTEAHSGDK